MEDIYTAGGLRSTKRERVDAFRSDATSKQAVLPSGYTFNSNKESMCLEYVQNFRSEVR